MRCAQRELRRQVMRMLWTSSAGAVLNPSTAVAEGGVRVCSGSAGMDTRAEGYGCAGSVGPRVTCGVSGDLVKSCVVTLSRVVMPCPSDGRISLGQESFGACG